MMPSSPLPLLLLVLATLCSCKTVRILVQPSASLANPATLSEVTAATLVTSGRTYRTLLQTDNAFVFRNVTEGSYLLEVLAPSHLFAPLRVDVDHTGAVAGAWVTFRGNTWENRGPALPVLVDEHAYTIETRAAMEKTYFVLREGFQPLKMLGSPMILIAIFSLVMVYFLPRMMEKSKCFLWVYGKGWCSADSCVQWIPIRSKN